MQINTILFSKDRAMQLDAVLHSFFLHCLDATETTQLYVIYKSSSARHAAQYQRLETDYPAVRFIRQGKFRRDLLNLLNSAPTPSFLRLCYQLACALGAASFRTGHRLDLCMRRWVDTPRRKLIHALIPRDFTPGGTLFLVDDNIFVSDFRLNPMIQALCQNPKTLGFSLRLGHNTIVSYAANEPQSLPGFSLVSDNILQFRWVEARHDFGYPLEVSSSLYLNRSIAPLLASVAFRNPNELEAAIASRTSVFRESHPVLLCFERSVTFCNPVNIVQSFHPNRTGEHVQYGVDEPLKRFERGERVDVQAYSGFVPNGCHQEVELFFKRT